MMEQGFEEVCALHGGQLIEDGVIPNTDLKIFQPFSRFSTGDKGVILGLATMPDGKMIPTKNKSRLAGTSINYQLSLRLDLDLAGPKVGDAFALILVSRSREKAGHIQDIALGVIDSQYESFLFYEAFDKFLSGYADLVVPHDDAALAALAQPAASVSLKKNVTRFVPPETPEEKEGGGSGAAS